MKRTVSAVALLAVVGASSALAGPYMSQYWNQPTPDGIHWGAYYPTSSVPGVVGPYGQGVPVAAPYCYGPQTGEAAAKAMLAQSMPLDLVMQAGMMPPSGMPLPPRGIQQAQAQAPAPPGVVPPGNLIAPPGISPAPGMPPMPPGMGPGPGGLAPMPPGLPPGLQPPGAVAAVGALTAPTASPFCVQRSEVRFAGPAGMKVSWFAPGPDGKPGFGAQFLETPGRYNFLQAAIYRLKLSDIPNHPGLVLYPTLEVVPSKIKTATFLAHSAVPVNFTEEDFEQVAAGNFVVKVIYLPDPMFQDLAVGGPDEVVSTRLEPGVDPIHEAQRRGSIMLVVRLGNIDLEAPNTPAMDAPGPIVVPPGGHAQAPTAPPGIAAPGLPGMPGLPGLPGLPGGPGAMPIPPAGRGPVPGMPAVLPPAGLPPAGLPPTLPPAPGTGTPSAPALPVGKTTTNSSLQQATYAEPASKKPQPTLAELAGQLPPPPATPQLPPNGSR
jgi:hypothetical protein